MDGRIFNDSKYILLATSVAFIYSCSNNSNNIAAFKALDEGLTNSNKLIDRSTETIYKSLEDKLSDPGTAQKAQIWYPKADMIKKLSTGITDYIENLKADVRKETTLSNAKAAALYKQLTNYKGDLMNIDSAMTDEFEKNIVITTISFDTIQTSQKDFAKNFFHTISMETVISILSKFQNNIKISENRMINFCNSQISIAWIHDWPGPLVEINSKYVKLGDEIEITAGISSFLSYPGTEISINGMPVPINYNGVGIYKFKTTKSGKHFIPIKLSYTDQDGKKQTIDKIIDYTVAGESVKE